MWGFTKFYFQPFLNISAFYLEKQKSFIPKKKILKPLSISKQKSFVYCLNFLEGFGLSISSSKIVLPKRYIIYKVHSGFHINCCCYCFGNRKRFSGWFIGNRNLFAHLETLGVEFDQFHIMIFLKYWGPILRVTLPALGSDDLSIDQLGTSIQILPEPNTGHVTHFL